MFGLLNGLSLTNKNELFPAPSYDQIFNQQLDSNKVLVPLSYYLGVYKRAMKPEEIFSLTKKNSEDEKIDWTEDHEDMHDYNPDNDEDENMDDNEDYD